MAILNTVKGASSDVVISTSGIYGIKRDITSPDPNWTRTDKAVKMSARATIGTTVNGESSFNYVMPWAGIKRETLSTGDVMVKIPKFYYQRYRAGNIEYIKISPKSASGFAVHPAFTHNGATQEYIYVGAYKQVSSNKSLPGYAPQVSQNRRTMANNAKSKGAGWGILDFTTMSAIQMLILVEFATNDVQTAIGRGVCSASAVIKTGTCDSVSGLTGALNNNNTSDVVYRGIEGFWGNTWEWVDGLNWNNGEYLYCNNQAQYACDTATNYKKLGYSGATNWSSSYITSIGLDTANSFAMMPQTASGGNEKTYICDGAWSSTGYRVFERGGSLASGSFVGLFGLGLNSASGAAGSSTGSRLLYIPTF